MQFIPYNTKCTILSDTLSIFYLHKLGGFYMKKSTILALSSLAIVFFIITSIGNRTKVYEKQIRYENPEEAIINFIGYANSYERVKSRDGYYNITSKEFLESISRRYKLCIGEDSMTRWALDRIPVFYSYELSELNEKDVGNIKVSHETSYNKIPNYKKPKEVRYYKLDAVVSYESDIDKNLVKSDGTIDKTSEALEENIDFYLVVVDEGEGYVVDYYRAAYS